MSFLFFRNGNMQLAALGYYWWRVLLFSLGGILVSYGVYCQIKERYYQDFLDFLKRYQEDEMVTFEKMATYMQINIIELAKKLDKYIKYDFMTDKQISFQEQRVFFVKNEKEKIENEETLSVILVRTEEKNPWQGYAVGLVWILYALSFPLYRIGDFLSVTGISIFFYVYTNILYGKKTVFTTKTYMQANQTGDPVVDDFLEKAVIFTSQLEKFQETIQSAQMNSRIERIMSLSKRFFELIGKENKLIRTSRTFVDYYLPTTIKLLEEYEKMEKYPQAGESISTMMVEIENALQKIEAGFSSEIDRLYGKTSLDLSAEIKVLNHLLETEILNQDKVENNGK
ncbi:MAG: hypothetical protein GX786_02475 [Clostridiales bacterium]|nr:hypothetical protein [Clostridiales bacterium]